MKLFERLDREIVEALKAGQKDRLTALRGLKSDIKYYLINNHAEPTDEVVQLVLTGCAKKRRESIEEYRKGGREELAVKEESELAIIQAYLPEPLSEERLREIIKQAIAESGADSPAKMGLVMKVLMPRVKGLADGRLVQKLVSEMLAN
ncbi:MAG: GatB/YqeY domain-containing protein [candidate division Zixibacteria bacterium]|nr:GatB/YqeY domain-containing protein [candidate division Zixibacteria bacterium]